MTTMGLRQLVLQTDRGTEKNSNTNDSRALDNLERIIGSHLKIHTPKPRAFFYWLWLRWPKPNIGDLSGDIELQNLLSILPTAIYITCLSILSVLTKRSSKIQTSFVCEAGSWMSNGIGTRTMITARKTGWIFRCSDALPSPSGSHLLPKQLRQFSG